MGSANAIRRCTVTSTPIGWTHIQNDSWFYVFATLGSNSNTSFFAFSRIKYVDITTHNFFKLAQANYVTKYFIDLYKQLQNYFLHHASLVDLIVLPDIWNCQIPAGGLAAILKFTIWFTSYHNFW